MTPDDLVHRLGALLLDDPEVVVRDDWSHVVLVATFHETSTGVTGFCYPERGEPEPAAPYDSRTLDVLRDLRTALADRDGTRGFVACRVHLQRAGARIGIDFEHDDPQRWAITFADRVERAAELDPRPPAAR